MRATSVAANARRVRERCPRIASRSATPRSEGQSRAARHHVVAAHYGSGNDREALVPRLDGSTVEIDFRPGPDDGSRSENEPEEFF